MPDAHSPAFLVPILALIAAAVVFVPVAKRVGLGAIVGYLLAGIAVGPSGLRLVIDPATTLGIAELGVVMLLFVIGLELKPARLAAMRKAIIGFGGAQVLLCTAALLPLALAVGTPLAGSVVVSFALALSATSIALRILEDRGDLRTPYGEKGFAVLLMQDIAVAPALALVPLLAGRSAGTGAPLAALIAAGALVGLVVVGRWLLNPLFRILARTGARELMTAAALLVVLGAALLLQTAGLSMALGAFVAGLLLAESDFRHQLEADIEPFRGLLLGLFFMSVGMTLQLGVVMDRLGPLLGFMAAVLGIKAVVVFAIARARKLAVGEAVRLAALLSPAGEFAFVFIPLAADLRLIGRQEAVLWTALSALTMIGGPLLFRLSEIWCARRKLRLGGEADYDIEGLGRTRSEVLVIGFGRFGQLSTQLLLAADLDVIVIERDTDMIRNAARFGFKVYYGDGTRLDVLRAAGAERARLIAVCIDDREAATRIVDIVSREFPEAALHVRAYDRNHALELMDRNVAYYVRETAPAAIAFGRAALRAAGFDAETADAVAEDVRRRDEARLAAQRGEGPMGGAHYLYGRGVRPEPLLPPKAEPKGLNEETERLVGQDGTGHEGRPS